MTYRVIQWTTGTVAKEAVIGIAGHPDLELVGAWTHRPRRTAATSASSSAWPRSA